MSHVHERTDELHVFWIPADTDMAMVMRVIRNSPTAMKPLVNGGYIERVHTELMPDLPCGCAMTMIVNEEGLIRRLPDNPRASIYYPYTLDGIKGDAFLMGAGMVNNRGEVEPDGFSLPPSFVTWEGPGSPVPTGKQPWEE